MGLITQLTIKSAIINEVKKQKTFTGFKIRGLIYKILREVDEDLATKLHEAKKLAPIAVTPIYKERKTSHTAYMKITILDEKLSQKLSNYILKLPLGSILNLDVLKLQPLEVSIVCIDTKKLVKNAEPITKFSIIFKTPTLFRQSFIRACCPYCPIPKTTCPHISKAKHYRYVPMPDPYLMLRNLLRLWKAFTGVNLKFKEYVEWLLLGGIAIAGIPKLKTIRIYEHPTIPKWSVGFIGKVYFNLPEDTYNEELAKTTDALLRFGEYSNVGANRTAGFGVIKYQPKI
ncbi:MAG: hypothetical protein DRP00_01910 [Candidatus Aenigmatarchaeota archaeon]|nr:MAG: hypothetical protein DRP00_01910 [Candidatus Aenigmarchaeota archaeon]